MSNDTMFGRVKFSYTQRNIGRSPLLLQRQARHTSAFHFATLVPWLKMPCSEHHEF